MSAGTRPRIERSRIASAEVRPRLWFQFVVLLAAHLLTPRLAQGAPLFRCRGLHSRNIHSWFRAAQPRYTADLHFSEEARCSPFAPRKTRQGSASRGTSLVPCIRRFCLLPPVLSLRRPPVAAQTAQKPLTVEQIFAHRPLIGNPPGELTWSPDGKHLTYLDGGELIDLDPAPASRMCW